MNFKDSLITGTLIKRYKRFFIDILYNNRRITAHCPNSGSMLGLLDEKNRVWLSKAKNPKRKLKYTLEIIKVKKSMIGVNTLKTNAIVHEALIEKKIDSLKEYNVIKKEVFFNKSTRFDFLLSNKKRKCFLEVKNVTLKRKEYIAEFPDAVTERGTKHFNELIKAKKNKYDCCILYLIQRDDCKSFKIADDIDKIYKFSFDKAKRLGIKILCYDCKIDTKKIELNNKIKINY